MRGDLPSGTVTFLFTDIEGSAKLRHVLGAEADADALAEHRRVVREAFARHGGVEVDTQGDAFFIAFPKAPDAVAAACEAQEALASGPVSVRMGLHTGVPHVTDEGYVGDVVHEGARIAAVGHGGQILLSATTLDLVEVDVTDLGEHRLKDIEVPVPICQLGSTPAHQDAASPGPEPRLVGRSQPIVAARPEHVLADRRRRLASGRSGPSDDRPHDRDGDDSVSVRTARRRSRRRRWAK